MELFCLIYNSIVWLLIFVFIIYSLHAMIISRNGQYPPFVPTVGEAKKFILRDVSKILEKSKEPLTILDPGCGLGTLIIPLAKKFPNHKFVGIDWSFPYYVAKLRARKLKNVEIYHDDMFNHSFSNVDIVVCFLVNKLTFPFVEKLIKDARKKVLLYSVYFQMPLLNLEKEFKYKHLGLMNSSVYVYELDMNRSNKG